MKTKRLYTLQNRNNQPVQIDLANYKVVCTKTNTRKSFYHKYLFDLITRKYNGNIDTFRTTYVSRAARPATSQADRIAEQIERTKNKLDQLLMKQVRLQQHQLEHADTLIDD